MKIGSKSPKRYGRTPTVILNPTMGDGTGFCRGALVSLGGEIKCACVNGPAFDGHKVDIDELIKRLATYKEEEKISLERFNEVHECKLINKIEGADKDAVK